jgi:hypothetical protein
VCSYAKTILTGAELLAIRQCLRGSEGHHIVDAHQLGDETAHGRSGGRQGLPFPQRPAFIGLEMTEPDPPDLRGWQQLGNGVAHDRKEPPHARVEQQRFIVAHEELIELQIRLGHERGDAIDIGSDFRDLGHWFFLAFFINRVSPRLMGLASLCARKPLL